MKIRIFYCSDDRKANKKVYMTDTLTMSALNVILIIIMIIIGDCLCVNV